MNATPVGSSSCSVGRNAGPFRRREEAETARPFFRSSCMEMPSWMPCTTIER